MSKGWMRAYVVQHAPLRKLVKESQNGMYFTLFVLITFACSLFVTKHQQELIWSETLHICPFLTNSKKIDFTISIIGDLKKKT